MKLSVFYLIQFYTDFILFYFLQTYITHTLLLQIQYPPYQGLGNEAKPVMPFGLWDQERSKLTPNIGIYFLARLQTTPLVAPKQQTVLFRDQVRKGIFSKKLATSNCLLMTDTKTQTNVCLFDSYSRKRQVSTSCERESLVLCSGLEVLKLKSQRTSF